MRSPEDKTLPRRLLGRFSIGGQLTLVFTLGLLIASLSVYLMFQSYRLSAVRDMARSDGEHIARLVFQHVYSGMLKGVSQAEVDVLLQRVSADLPGYRIELIRGQPVTRQFGPRPGQHARIAADPALQRVLTEGTPASLEQDGILRYLLPLPASTECLGCHSQARAGEINGVVDVHVPLARLEQPLTDLAYPLVAMILALQALFFGLIYLILRSWVSTPIRRLAHDVSLIMRARDYAHRVQISRVWPQEVKTLALGFGRLLRQIRRSHQRLRELSLHDPLTGLYNRRHFDAALEAVLAAPAEYCEGRFALLLIDLDGFKTVNDRYGHAAGDALLVAVGRALAQAMRESDVAARIGGDEFAVLAFIRQPEELPPLIERLRAAIEGCTIRVGDRTLPASCSIGGVFHAASQGDDAAPLLAEVDARMYADKAARRYPSADDRRTG